VVLLKPTSARESAVILQPPMGNQWPTGFKVTVGCDGVSLGLTTVKVLKLRQLNGFVGKCCSEGLMRATAPRLRRLSYAVESTRLRLGKLGLGKSMDQSG
jgi:hypothetical protein